MKAGTVLALIAALAFGPVTARAEGKIAIGPQGGLTFPDFHVKDATIASTYANKNGWVGGIFLEFGIWALTLRPELNMVQKGYTVANVGTVNNRYLEVPVLLKFNPLGELPVSPFLAVGPQWSKHISDSFSPVSGGSTTYTDTAADWDISGVAGLGVDINLAKSLALELQGRYSYGFRNVDNASSTTVNVRGFYVLGGISIQDAF